MSGSETGAVVTTREPFTVGVQKSPPPSQTPPVVQSMRLAYSSDGAAVYQPISDSSPPPYPSNATVDVTAAAPIAAFAPQPLQQNLNMNMEEPVKKKRGRPRKYGPDGPMALALTTSPASAPPSSGPFSPSLQSPHSGGSASGSSMKKPRGRPPGSSNKKHQMEAVGSAGIGFTPHIIEVKLGEDVSSKIMSFSQNGPRAVCVLSANGAISNVTLRQAATSGGTATYEGRFDILSLSGSFLLSEVDGHRSRTGGLSISLAGPDGRVLGGCVAGLLTAASPVQVIVGSFIADGRKESKSVNQMDLLSAPQKLFPSGGVAGPTSPLSRGTLSDSSGGPGSPLNQSTGAYNSDTPQGMSSMPWK